MTDFQVFNVIDTFRREHCGFRPRMDIKKRFKRLNSLEGSVCSQLSTLAQTREDIEFLVGLAYVKFGDPWENMAGFLKEKTPKSLKAELKARTEQDMKAVTKMMATSGITLKELFRTPPGGRSIAFNLLGTLTISPWCYVYHLDKADGLKLTKDEVKTLNIVKELVHEKR